MNKLSNDVEVSVSLGVLVPTEIWEEKDVWLAKENDSLKEWERMDEDDRTVVIEIVRDSLERLSDRLPEWVPSSLVVEEGRYVDVTFRVVFTTIEEQKDALKELTNRKVLEAAEGAVQLVQELSNNER